MEKSAENFMIGFQRTTSKLNDITKFHVANRRIIIEPAKLSHSLHQIEKQRECIEWSSSAVSSSNSVCQISYS